MSYNKDIPYNNLPELPPQFDVESKKVLKKANSANKALAELKGIANSIPDQNILINSIILQEAKSSSQIENVITTNDKLYQAFSLNSNNIDPQTKEVLRYRESLWNGYNKLKNRKLLTTNLFIEIVQFIKSNKADIRTLPGTKIANLSTGETIYTPPEGEVIIRNKLKNLENFINTDKDRIEPLVKTAIIHYQFESIHPFSDGNGRTGRIIIILYLILQELLDLPILYLSKYIIDHKLDYYKLFQEVTQNNNWEDWTLFVLDSIEKTSIYTVKKIKSIRNLLTETIEKARIELPPRVYSKELIEIIFEQPYCRIKNLVDKGIVKRQAAADYLKELEEIGILKKKKVGHTNLFLNIGLYNLLKK